MTFEQSFERSEEVNCKDVRGGAVQAEGTAHAKALRWEHGSVPGALREQREARVAGQVSQEGSSLGET